MSKEHILVIEDEEDILELVKYNLGKEGYGVTCVVSGEHGLEVASRIFPSLIILDLMLPGIDGLEVCRKLKNDRTTEHIPIIMLTAKSEEADIVTGLELGADDYITKPFSPRVMISRIRTVLRRKTRETTTGESPLVINEITIHPGRHEVLVHDQKIPLTSGEFRLLHCLAMRPGWVFTRDQIVGAVHSDEYAVTDRSVDVQIVSLRKKLGNAGYYIETVRGVGYRFRDLQ